MSIEFAQLCSEWISAKNTEREAIENRRVIEDQLVEMMAINMTEEGVNNLKTNGYQIKATTRMTRKVDSDLVQEIAQEYGLTHYLPILFRWKPELELRAWKSTGKEITDKLLPAITTTAGRPSFAITTIEE